MPYDRTQHIIGQGKKLEYSDTSGGTYTAIFGTIEINLPEREFAAEEITNDSTPDRLKDYIIGLGEPGEMDFTYAYGKTQFAAIEAVFALGYSTTTAATATKFWRYTLPDGSVASWRGFLTSHNLPAEIEGQLVVEGSMQAVSKITFTAGA